MSQSTKMDSSSASHTTQGTSQLISNLLAALPQDVIFLQDGETFSNLLKGNWAQQECESIPACIVRPSSTEQLCKVLPILEEEHQRRKESKLYDHVGTFAIRSGGHSPTGGAASIAGGVLIDMSLFKEITVNDDAVVIGTGARWGDVYEVLEPEGRGVVGGRDSSVGVGGFILGGGLSFFTPRYGLACSNVISYEIVLANGSVVNASANTNQDLWCALKGGSNNFGIVTRFTALTFPCDSIWGGYLYMPSFQAPKVIQSFHEYVSRKQVSPEGVDDQGSVFDQNAAGPIVSFVYIPTRVVNFQLVACNMVYTKGSATEDQRYPSCWQSTTIPSLFRYWSTCRQRTLKNMTDELSGLSPHGKRQLLATTTVTNDLETLAAAYAAFQQTLSSLQATRLFFRGLIFSFTFQPLLQKWLRKDGSSTIGLPSTNDDDDDDDEHLVMVSMSITWLDRAHDQILHDASRQLIESIEDISQANGTFRPWKYLNYCAKWQQPYQFFDSKIAKHLQDVRIKYDPSGLFQTGCVGGFKFPQDVR